MGNKGKLLVLLEKLESDWTAYLHDQMHSGEADIRIRSALSAIKELIENLPNDKQVRLKI